MSDALVEIAGTLVMFSIEMSDEVKEMFVAVSRTVLTSFVIPPCKMVTMVFCTFRKRGNKLCSGLRQSVHIIFRGFI